LGKFDGFAAKYSHQSGKEPDNAIKGQGKLPDSCSDLAKL